MHAVVCVAGLSKMQALSPRLTSVIFSLCGLQPCESLFGKGRDPYSLQHTGSLSGAGLAALLPKIAATQADEAWGVIVLAKGRKAGQHVLHSKDRYTQRLSDHDMSCALAYGIMEAEGLLRSLGYGPILDVRNIRGGHANMVSRNETDFAQG